MLAIVAEPPAILLDVPEPISMSFRALVVDPRGGPVDYTWSFCPVESNNACADYEQRRAAAGADDGPALDLMRAIAQSGTAVPKNEAEPPPPLSWWATRAVWPYAVPELTIAAPEQLWHYHFATSFLGMGLGAWPAATLQVAGADDTVTAEKRVVLGVRDLRRFVEFWGAALPYRVCPDGMTPAEVPGCLNIKNMPQNRNPVFAAVKVAEGKNATEPVWTEVEIGQPGDVAGLAYLQAGASIRVLPEFTAESYQPYQVVKGDLVNGTLFTEDRVEELSVSWFTTAGKTAEDLTWPKFTKSLDTSYTAPEEPPAATDGRVTIFMVARDQRGGESVMSLELIVRP
ncbi:MAG: hypothetical protein HY903_09475 [Deltaproteobacteria bacterium]|nr:hypothetical protein [Deltaproteobacteria bacterium]